MKIIDAFWEKRNLGIETKEIILSADDTLLDIDTFLNSLSSEKQYIVIKMPVGKLDFIKFLTEKGFYFVESLFEMSIRIETFHLPASLKRFDDMLFYDNLTTDNALKRLEKEIQKGIFTTDRIALDKNFGIDVAAMRYVNWIKDEMKKGSEVFEILYKENPIGFFTLKKLSNGNYDNFLSGMYRDERNIGFGFSIISKPILELKRRKAFLYVSHVSSNNLPALRLANSFGFLLEDISYVMIKI